jgi:DNA polymerase III subunit epsilon
MNFSNERFCIVDIETTGGISKRDKITEIAIIVYHNGEIIETFESLINPERSIPSEITRITGITNQMVEDAPKFYEIAKQILQLTEGCIFVAHNVFFDYNFIKEEFFQLGYTYSRNKLCTVQLSRRHFKGLKSYSLGALIDHFNIPVSNRHRAMEDSKATLNLFVKIIEKIASAKTTEFSLTEVLKENRIPPHLNMSDLAKLPERTGIYYFRDQVGNPVYI